jgi:hypothetical protein
MIGIMMMTMVNLMMRIMIQTVLMVCDMMKVLIAIMHVGCQ